MAGGDLGRATETAPRSKDGKLKATPKMSRLILIVEIIGNSRHFLGISWHYLALTERNVMEILRAKSTVLLRSNSIAL
jgi:hypothetical protein